MTTVDDSGSLDHRISDIQNLYQQCLLQHNQKITAAEQRVSDLRDKCTDNWELIRAEISVATELRNQQNEFQLYWKNLTQSSNASKSLIRDLQKIKNNFLFIYSCKKSDIIKKIEEKCVTILTAETGSGKSTQLVQYLYDEGFCNGGRIACTQPRKIAAISLAKRVAEEMDTNLGNIVGCRVGMQNIVGKNTSIVFVTDQTLLNECLKDSSFSKYNCIVVDEAHERSIGTDLLLAMIKKAFVFRPDLRLIISSATIDSSTFKTYFQHRASDIHVLGRTFPRNFMVRRIVKVEIL